MSERYGNCEKCDGTGSRPDWAHQKKIGGREEYLVDGVRIFVTIEMELVECSLCGGTGQSGNALHA
jgi:hypothetical protein